MYSFAARRVRIGENIFLSGKQRGSARINVATLHGFSTFNLAGKRLRDCVIAPFGSDEPHPWLLRKQREILPVAIDELDLQFFSISYFAGLRMCQRQKRSNVLKRSLSVIGWLGFRKKQKERGLT